MNTANTVRDNGLAPVWRTAAGVSPGSLNMLAADPFGKAKRRSRRRAFVALEEGERRRHGRLGTASSVHRDSHDDAHLARKTEGHGDCRSVTLRAPRERPSRYQARVGSLEVQAEQPPWLQARIRHWYSVPVTTHWSSLVTFMVLTTGSDHAPQSPPSNWRRCSS
jgi:hypothetical protein